MSDISFVQKNSIPAVGSISIYMHKSGAKIFFIDNADTNNVFSLAFDTLAHDDTGIPHILEHCVLGGSRAFPAKDPFNMLCQNTSNTYLNAITFSHKTIFPVASADEKALMLMARVYCDGIFDPLVYENKGIFLQEGGFFDGKNFGGVVYSEMSGFYADTENAAEQCLKHAFTAHFSAGTPDMIPFAKYEDLLEYHKKYYTAANCLAYVYGSIDKKPFLSLLEKYFSAFHGTALPRKHAQFKHIYKTSDIPYNINMALYPLCPTSDPYLTTAYEIITAAIQQALPDLKITYNNDGDIAYAKITGDHPFEARVKNAAKSLVINAYDIDRARFRIAAGDFGYKPRGLFYGLKLMQSGNINSLDFKNIFDKIKKNDLSTLAGEGFIKNGIYSNFVPKKQIALTYPLTDTTPLKIYANSPDIITDIKLPLAKAAKQPTLAINDKTVYIEADDPDIIYIALAFTLDLPQDLIKHTGALLQNLDTVLYDAGSEFIDLGRPCFVIHTGFFAKDADTVIHEINRFFRCGRTNYAVKYTAVPEHYTQLLALSGTEKNSAILQNAYGIGFCYEKADLKTAQQAVFTEENMYCAVCTHPQNFNICKKIISKLSLYKSFDTKHFEFIPDTSQKIIKVEQNTNTISLAFKHTGTYAAAFAAAEWLKNTYLWQTVRNAGAYGCNCIATHSGSLCMTSFKDINFDKTVQAFYNAKEYMLNTALTHDEMHRCKIMCLNTADRPKSYYKKCLYAIEKLFGVPDICMDIPYLKSEDIQAVFADTGSINSIAAFKAN